MSTLTFKVESRMPAGQDLPFGISGFWHQEDLIFTLSAHLFFLSLHPFSFKILEFSIPFLPIDCPLMFSHTEEVVVFLFSFWGHFECYGSPFLFSVLHVSKSKLSSQLTAGKDLWGLLFFFFCSPFLLHNWKI